MNAFRPDPSARYLAWGIALLALGQGFVVLGLLTVPGPAYLGAVLSVAGLVAVVVGVYNLASNVDYLARRAAEKNRAPA